VRTKLLFNRTDMNKHTFLLFFLLLLLGCKKEDTPVSIAASDAILVDIGQANSGFVFETTRNAENDSDIDVRIKTIDIRRVSTIDTIICSLLNNTFSITARFHSDYDFYECVETGSCLTMHELFFKLHDVKKGDYNIDLSLTSMKYQPFGHVID